GSLGSFPDELTNVNGEVYFRALDASAGLELFRTDGTAFGTVLADIDPGRGDSFPRELTNLGGTLFFTAGAGVVGVDDRELFLIPDPAAPPSLSISDATVTEGNFGTVKAVFAVRLSQASNLPVTAHVSTADGTATVLGGDFQAL